MDIYTDPVTCGACGVRGAARAGEGVYAWFGATFYCKDREACAARINRRRRDLEKRVKELEEQLTEKETA